ncbi:YoaK family protein [Microvirga sp. 2MCAF35]|uniref:YoaK family protein n=1 Tax=Microvirga sp. 2MCAF35 TaxID=3232987 RepID=UPI003F9768FC
MSAQSTKPETRDFTIRAVKTIAAFERTTVTDTLLGMSLTFVAGAINAGGFLAVGQYTSHMSGIFSSMADNLALGSLGLASLGLLGFVPFVMGAACSAMLINWGRRHHLGSRYAMPLMVESVLLLGFGILGWLAPPSPGFVAVSIPLLCFIMGLQNATVTKISGARMRTTHVTGIVTDIGIELGKLLYWNRNAHNPDRIEADRDKLRLLVLLLASFFIGGVVGAIGFSHIGFLFALPFALLLLLLAGPPLAEDAVTLARRMAKR